jgi:polyphosphate kinase
MMPKSASSGSGRKAQTSSSAKRKSKSKAKPTPKGPVRTKATSNNEIPLRNRELSWLSFNARILQEASDPSVPLLERVRFLGIFSNNLDEFYRIRVAGLRRLADLGEEAEKILGGSPDSVLKEIRQVVLRQHKHFDKIFSELTAELAREQIHIIAEDELDSEQADFVRSFFRTRIRRHLIPLMLDQIKTLPALRDQSTYLAVELRTGSNGGGRRHALMEVPTKAEGRFVQLPPRDDGKYIILTDDVIRFCLADIFSAFGFKRYSAWAVKITKDGELDIAEDLSQSMVKKLARSLRQRHQGSPVRFTYDSELPRAFLKLLSKKLKVTAEDTLIPSQRYLNSRDFIQFPDLGPTRMRYRPQRPILHPAFQENGPLLATMAQRDVLLHYPYHSFDHFSDLLRECSIDPHVTAIKVTIYRAARNSSVINALINAARNGKSVTVVLELQARFDEEANLDWGRRLQEEGVYVIYGVPGLKVHAKLCLITRVENQRKVRYAVVGTGNFNEDTARLYGDHALFTSDVRITKEARRVFRFCESNYSLGTFRHLWVSPFNARQKLRKYIRQECRFAAAGEEAYIRIKLNNLTDPDVIKDLYAASKAGVRVELLVRSMFSLIPGLADISEGIEAKSIVDRYLEHSRFFIFGNKGKPAYFISSADCMPRNLDRRVEVVCPIYDKDLQREFETYFDLQWRDTAKTRILDVALTNRRPDADDASSSRSQYAIYRWLRRQARDVASHDPSEDAAMASHTN